MTAEALDIHLDDSVVVHAVTQAIPEFASGIELESRTQVSASRSSRTEVLRVHNGSTGAPGRSVVSRIFCKYGRQAPPSMWEYKLGVRHERDVYRYVLDPLDLSVARVLGSHFDAATVTDFLFLEHFEAATPIRYAAEHGLFVASEWLAAFHARALPRMGQSIWGFLPRMDRGYFEAWLDRAIRFMSRTRAQHPAFAELRRQRTEILDAFTTFDATIVHGDFYPANLLIENGRVIPVDWESACVGDGAVDIAALVEGWAPATSDECLRLYTRHRWNTDPNPDFLRRVNLARVYLLCRYFGHAADLSEGPSAEWRLAELEDALTRWKDPQ